MKIHKPIQFLYKLAYAILLLSFMMSRVTILPELIDSSKYIAYAVLIIVFFAVNKYNVKAILLFILFFSCTLVTAYITKETVILKVFLLILTSKDMDFDSIIKYDFKCRLTLFILVIVLHFLGLTNDFVTIRDGIVRFSFGFSHTNVFAFMLTLLNIEYFYINRFKKNKLKIIIFFVLSVIVIYKFTISRTNLISLVLFYVIYYLFNVFKLNRLFDKKMTILILKNSFVILTIVTAIFVYLYNIHNPLAIELNNAFNGRIKFIQEFMNNYNINLFGNRMSFVSSEKFYLYGIRPRILDNGYYHLLLHYGIITYAMFYFVYYKIIAAVLKNKDYFVLIAVIIFLILGITETFLFRIELNIFLFYFNTWIFKKDDLNYESN